jgi:hypothetical protein
VEGRRERRGRRTVERILSPICPSSLQHHRTQSISLNSLPARFTLTNLHERCRQALCPYGLVEYPCSLLYSIVELKTLQWGGCVRCAVQKSETVYLLKETNLQTWIYWCCFTMRVVSAYTEPPTKLARKLADKTWRYIGPFQTNN